jgi:hypothetical protein
VLSAHPPQSRVPEKRHGTELFVDGGLAEV